MSYHQSCNYCLQLFVSGIYNFTAMRLNRPYHQLCNCLATVSTWDLDNVEYDDGVLVSVKTIQYSHYFIIKVNYCHISMALQTCLQTKLKLIWHICFQNWGNLFLTAISKSPNWVNKFMCKFVYRSW